jgi:hypothetical protein
MLLLLGWVLVRGGWVGHGVATHPEQLPLGKTREGM